MHELYIYIFVHIIYIYIYLFVCITALHYLRRRTFTMQTQAPTDITFLKSSIKATKNKPSLLLKRKLRWILLQDFLQLQQNAKKNI